ncbi:MAG TPA: CBS domain-containing protein [Dehalococcoidia bacterium]|nr:CBS domain-containing protein [Dehalococcoidia bacterium]
MKIRREELADVMKIVRVKEVMTRDFPTISSIMALKEVTNLARNTGHHGFPILDDEGRLFGVVTLADLERSIQSGNTDRPVGEVATQAPIVAYPDQTLYEVLQASEKDYGRIPVVDPQDPGRLLGVLRRHDIVRAYRSRVAQKQTDER